MPYAMKGGFLRALYYVYMVVEVTMNMAEYGSRRSQQPANVNFEPMLDSIAKEKKWGKNGWKLVQLRGRGQR